MLLTNRLLRLLRPAAGDAASRVVLVSSRLEANGQLDLACLEERGATRETFDPVGNRGGCSLKSTVRLH